MWRAGGPGDCPPAFSHARPDLSTRPVTLPAVPRPTPPTPLEQAKAELNRALRVGTPNLSGQREETGSVPQPVTEAKDALTAALESDDREAILQADDALSAAISTARPRGRRVNWGQGARGSSAGGGTPSDSMNSRIRGAHNPASASHGRPGATGRIR